MLAESYAEADYFLTSQAEVDAEPEPTSEPTPVTVEPKYVLLFSVGAGGKIVDAVSGFECESKCEIKPDDVLQATYEVIPDQHYQFAGWSGDICNTPNLRQSSM